MIVAKFLYNKENGKFKLTVRGHANSNTYGNDTICACASMLSYTIAQNLNILHEQGKLKYSPDIRLKEGNGVIQCKADKDGEYDVMQLFLYIQSGFVLLAHNYPQYVAVEMFGDNG